ncbi:Porin, Gram-negative type [Methylophaga frappieri]|uniref:Porin, Gram-negative type n=1 Tax=Methylophaga frappieri (strain ATCC BAA-2434 / DSM 25690 / JAM7) TaxID=754477 RepID=I1YJ91_METFJ|nr:porin [Methylophaga frappieri]AFJ02984.1 Porin, Gram-negative type [Methylophaga frappieri]
MVYPTAKSTVTGLLIGLTGLYFLPPSVMAEEDEPWSLEWYASLRMQAESVRPDQTDALADYRGFRDAFSRVGVRTEYAFNPRHQLFGQIEIPFDSVNMRFRDSYDQGGVGRDERESLRVARLGYRSPVGTLVAGQQWMPYYNAILLPVDQFSTFYSGFASYTTFRVKETLAYESPVWGGFSFGASYSSQAGNARSSSRIDDRRIQAVASYAIENHRLSVGMDDRGNAQGFSDRLYGATWSFNPGPWGLAVKYEVTDTDNPNSFFGDDAQAINVFGSYQYQNNVFKLMLANVEGYGEAIIHAGVDHKYSDNLTLFAEFYQEQETAALTCKRCGLAGFDAAASGGKVFAVGFRYNLSY